MELEEHMALKSMWMEELREVAIGEEEGCEQGQHLEMIMEELLMKEEDLGEQHRGHRLALLVQTCMDSQQEPPCTFLQTLYGASTASSNGARVVEAANFGRVSVLDGDHGSFEGDDMELRRDPRFPQMEAAPDMLVPIR